MKFKKILSIIGSVFLIGSTVGIAVASNLNPMNEDISIIYGGNAATSDITSSIDISDSINSGLDSDITTFNKTSGVIENEVPLGGSITDGDDIRDKFTDNQISHLIDGKLEWDNGVQPKSKFNVHEEINIKKDTMNIITTLDDDELNGTALTNNKGLSYKYVFEEDINWTGRDEEDCDDLKITILGKEYEVTNMDINSITVTSSEEKFLNEGESTTVDGTTFTVENVYDDAAIINGVVIKEGKVKTINNIKVEVNEIFYTSKESSKSFVTLKIGEEISETYSNGDEYIEDDEIWIWDIETPGEKNGYIGVKYDIDSIDPDEGIIYAGESYIFPENYAELKFVKTTDVDYNEFEIYFDEEDLYNSTDEDKKRIHDDAKVAIIKGENDDSIVLQWNNNDVETDSIYLYHNIISNEIEVYFKDVNEEVDDNNKIRFAGIYDKENKPTLIVDDTEIDVTIDGTDDFTLTLNKKGMNDINIYLGETEYTVKIDNEDVSMQSFTHLGNEEENAESDEIKISGNSIGTEEEDVMDYYGNIIEDPEDNADDDKVIIQVPSEQVYATISILGEPQYETTNIDFTISTSSLKTTDKEKNMIVVGGSCINELAAELLGETEPVCGADFTALTGVESGEYMIQVFENPNANDKIAVLVAGYNAADTTRGVKEFLEQDFDLTVGQKYIR